MADAFRGLADFVRDHEAWAAPIVLLLAFGESLAFISLLIPAWGALVAREATLSGARPLGSEAPNRSLALAFVFDFNGFGIFFHVLRALRVARIISPDYAMDGLKK